MRKERECLKQKNEQRIRDLETERDKKVAASLIVVRRLENAHVVVPLTVKKANRTKMFKDCNDMKSLQTSLDVQPQHMKSVIRKKKDSPRKRKNEDDV